MSLRSNHRGSKVICGRDRLNSHRRRSAESPLRHSRGLAFLRLCVEIRLPKRQRRGIVVERTLTKIPKLSRSGIVGDYVAPTEALADWVLRATKIPHRLCCPRATARNISNPNASRVKGAFPQQSRKKKFPRRGEGREVRKTFLPSLPSPLRGTFQDLPLPQVALSFPRND